MLPQVIAELREIVLDTSVPTLAQVLRRRLLLAGSRPRWSPCRIPPPCHLFERDHRERPLVSVFITVAVALKRAATQMRKSRLVKITDRIGLPSAPDGQARGYSREGDYGRGGEQHHDRTVSTYAEN